MPDDIERLLLLQQEQEQALEAGEFSRVEALCAEGLSVLERLDVAERGDLQMRRRVRELIAQQRRLEGQAERVRGELLGELATIAPGREALASYRPAARDSAHWVDHSG